MSDVFELFIKSTWGCFILFYIVLLFTICVTTANEDVYRQILMIQSLFWLFSCTLKCIPIQAKRNISKSDEISRYMHIANIV